MYVDRPMLPCNTRARIFAAEIVGYGPEQTAGTMGVPLTGSQKYSACRGDLLNSLVSCDNTWRFIKYSDEWGPKFEAFRCEFGHLGANSSEYFMDRQVLPFEARGASVPRSCLASRIELNTDTQSFLFLFSLKRSSVRV